ncbi:Hypothetical protein D9617_24g016950 [Elsinoe fawcettii]|nr:Hypothetical protein D9617_24g016950 [Elsinoe fawcettii]
MAGPKPKASVPSSSAEVRGRMTDLGRSSASAADTTIPAPIVERKRMKTKEEQREEQVRLAAQARRTEEKQRAQLNDYASALVSRARVILAPGGSDSIGKMSTSKSNIATTEFYHRVMKSMGNDTDSFMTVQSLTVGSATPFAIQEVIKLKDGPYAGRIAFVVDPSLPVSKQFDLMKLPVEVRGLILKLLLSCGPGIEIMSTKKNKLGIKARYALPDHVMALFRTSKALHAEAEPIFYRNRAFMFDSTATALKFYDTMDKKIHFIHSISIGEWAANGSAKLMKRLIRSTSLRALHIEAI